MRLPPMTHCTGKSASAPSASRVRIVKSRDVDVDVDVDIHASLEAPAKCAWRKAPTTAAGVAGASARACQLCFQAASWRAWQPPHFALPMYAFGGAAGRAGAGGRVGS